MTNEVPATAGTGMNHIDVAVVAVYVVLMVGVGVVFARHMMSARDLFAASGNAVLPENAIHR